MQRARQAAVLLGVVGLAAVLAVVFTAEPVADRTDASSPAGLRVRILGDLENVENSISALQSVWVATSNLPDNFTLGEVDASILKIDPTTGQGETLLADLKVQPSFAATKDRVWAKLDERIVAFDQSGSETTSVSWEAEGEMFASEDQLWVTDFSGAKVVVINPATGQLIKTVETGRFPVAPILAFGHAWIPSSTDGTVTIIDEATLGDTTHLTVPVSNQRQTDVTPVPGGSAGDEVWVTNLEGELIALSAEQSTLGRQRNIEVDRPINKVLVQGNRVVLLPTWGTSVLIADLDTNEVLAVLGLDSIPFRAVVRDNTAWVTSDGPMEALTKIDLDSLAIIGQVQIGANQSNTTGPTQPFVVGDEIWVPNRGDNTMFVVSDN